MKKPCLLALLALILVLLISCSTQSPEDEVDESWDFWEPEEKTLIIWSNQGQQWRDEYAEAFTLDNPEFTLSMGTMGSDDFSGIALAIQTGVQPDAFYNTHWAQRFYFAQTIQPFDYYIENDTNYNVNDIHRTAYERGTMDGKVYGMTSYMSILMMVYNKDLLETNGFDPDVHPKYWDEMLERQKALVKYDGRGKCTQVAILGTPGWCYQYASMYDGMMHGPANGVRVDLNRPAMWAIWEITYELEDVYGGKGNLDADLTKAHSPNDGDRRFGFNSGKVAYELSDYGMPWWFESVPNYGVCNMPQFPHNDKEFASAVTHNFFYLTRDSRNPDGAWFFVRWYLTNGMIAVGENNNYNKDPVSYFPSFFSHTYTRQRCYDLYLDEISENSLEAIEFRDALAEIVNGYDWGHAANDWGSFHNSIYSTLSARKAPIRDALKEIQRIQDLASDRWIEDMEKKGWIIDEEHPWGIPPELDTEIK